MQLLKQRVLILSVSKMAERPNLFSCFVLAVIAIPSIVTGYDEGYWYPDDTVDKGGCKWVGIMQGLECVPFCRGPEPFCNFVGSHCACEDGKLLCDKYLDSCRCFNSGVKFPKCTEPCDEGTYGQHCDNRCRCKNNATCDRFSGKCTCAAGYQGSLCKKKCPKGTHGYQCSNECKCQNDAICHHVDGSCDCTAGWMGSVCAEPCLEGTYGINCSETCDCFKNAPCNVTTGDCIYTDDVCDCRCDTNPPSEWKELNDDQEVSSILNTNKHCLPGFSGTNCENRACPVNKWGETCSNECKCKNRSYCHPETGSCWCEFGWTGEDCSVTINEGSGMTYEVTMDDNSPTVIKELKS